MVQITLNKFLQLTIKQKMEIQGQGEIKTTILILIHQNNHIILFCFVCQKINEQNNIHQIMNEK